MTWMFSRRAEATCTAVYMVYQVIMFKSPWDLNAMPKSRYKNTLDRRWSFLEKIYYIVYLYERSLGRRQAWQRVRLKNEEKSVSYTLESKKPANFHVCWMGKKIKIYYRFSSFGSTWLRDIWLLRRWEIRSYTFVCLNQFYSLTTCLLLLWYVLLLIQGNKAAQFVVL